jgi:alpha-1,6-mannosyltransferase
MLTILDINNFWSPSGGGVRRYHLQKMDFYQKKQNEFKLVFLMQDSCNKTEEISPTLTIEHVKAFKVPGKWWEYRFIYSAKEVRPYIEKYNADIIEVGSPYVLPAAVRRACNGLAKKPALTAFWHADFPVTYVRRALGKMFEHLAWAYARYQFKDYKGIQVSCKEVMERMKRRGLSNLHQMPLGIDSCLFSPNRKDNALIEELKSGDPNRLTMFFPHRFCKEKGVSLLLDAYPIICEKLGIEPALIFVGTGNRIHLVEAAAKKYKHIRYAGFIKNAEEMAKWSASCEVGFALSGWETFGFSILEGMACGESLIGASTGAAAEHISESGGGIILRERTPQALAAAVCEIAQNKEKMQAMGAKGRAYAERFSWDACFERQMEFYKEVVKKMYINQGYFELNPKR